MRPLADMTVRELEKVEKDVATKRAELGELHKAVRGELDRRIEERKTLDKVSSMSPAEKASLLQMLQTASVESEEKFGQLGG